MTTSLLDHRRQNHCGDRQTTTTTTNADTDYSAQQGRPHAPQDRKLGKNGAFITFFKSLFGAGLLSLPNALGRVGIVLGFTIYATVGIGCTFSCYLLLEARQQALKTMRKQQRNDHPKHGHHHTPKQQQQHLVTYGDLADILLGHTMASITRWTIIVLNILFTAGLAIVICENLGNLLMSMNANSGHDDYRMMAGLFLLPIVICLLQIPWLQDMWFISVMGLAVYTIGVIGSTVFSASWTIVMSATASSSSVVGNNYTIEQSSFTYAQQRSMPDDLWTFNWNGIPSFVGTAVYALEGINLALPTAHSMQAESQATQVVCSGVMWYATITIMFASVGYAGGLGGGAGTGLTAEKCDVVTNCITPPFLKNLIQITLSIAMTLSIPVMLYPSTEMLEVMLTDAKAEQQQYENQNLNCDNETEEAFVELEPLRNSDQGQENVLHHIRGHLSHAALDSKSMASYGSTNLTKQSDTQRIRLDGNKATSNDFVQEKSWKLRIFLACLTVTMGAVTPSFTHYSEFVGAVGLSFAGFVLPPLLYFRAMEQAHIPLSPRMEASIATLTIFGLCNMIAGGISSMKDLLE